MSSYSMSGRQWTEGSVIAAIRAEARSGHDLSYSATEKRVPSLIRAAERVFGSWAGAVNASGFDYDSIRRYRKWSRKRVIERIADWKDKGADLSWRNVSTELDPPLAAAALHAGRFESWADALKAAGLDPRHIAKYRRWTLAEIREELKVLDAQGISLDRDTLNEVAPALLAAIYRIGGGLVAEREQMRKLMDGTAMFALDLAEWNKPADEYEYLTNGMLALSSSRRQA